MKGRKGPTEKQMSWARSSNHSICTLGVGWKTLEKNNKVQHIKISKESAGSFQLLGTKTTGYKRIFRRVVKSEALNNSGFRETGKWNQKKKRERSIQNCLKFRLFAKFSATVSLEAQFFRFPNLMVLFVPSFYYMNTHREHHIQSKNISIQDLVTCSSKFLKSLNSSEPQVINL